MSKMRSMASLVVIRALTVARILTIGATLLVSASVSLAQGKGPYFELVETIPDASGGGWTVADGRISLAGAGGTLSEHIWTSPPKAFDATGFSIALNIKVYGINTRVSGGTALVRGVFSADQNPAGAVALAEVGESKSNNVSLHLTPPTGSADGSIVELRIGASFGPSVLYRYRVSRTPVPGNPQPQPQPQPPPQPPGRLSATVSCDAPALVISQLPSVTCALRISGFRRNTADPVQVILPQALDLYGNHANGIQLIDADGEEDVFGWESPHVWPFFIFACPGQSGTGASCYGNAATPGTRTVPIIVRQKGLEDANVQLVLNVIARGTPVAGAGRVARIGNRAIAGTFINIEPGSPVNSPILLDWLSARWNLEPVAGTEFVRLRSVWKPEVYIHTERGQVEAGSVRPEWWSAMWAIEDAGIAGYVRIRNRYRSDQYLNVESGRLASSPVDAKSPSAMWWLLR